MFLPTLLLCEAARRGAPERCQVSMATGGSALSGSTWRLRLDVGRQPGSAMPAEWAASGARLSLTVDVRFDEDAAVAGTEERLLGPAKYACGKTRPGSQPVHMPVEPESDPAHTSDQTPDP